MLTTFGAQTKIGTEFPGNSSIGLVIMALRIQGGTSQVTLEQYLNALADNERPLRNTDLMSLSDMTAEGLELLRDVTGLNATLISREQQCTRVSNI